MAKKKGKSKKNNKIKLTLPLVIFITLIVIAAAIVFGISYKKTIDELDSVTVSVNVEADGDSAKGSITVKGKFDTYDVIFVNGEDSYTAVSESEAGTTPIDIKLKYGSTYEIVVNVYSNVLSLISVSNAVSGGELATEPKKPSTTDDAMIYDDFQIHFMQLGNAAAGDSIYIKAGDIDILIDAGSEASSALVIENYIDQYCTDGKLEYLIATHSDTDHIVGFAGKVDTKAKNFKGEQVDKNGIFYYYDIGTIIDFNYRYDSSAKKYYDNKSITSADLSSSTVYGKYVLGREYAVSKGATHYTGYDCWNEVGTAKKTYTLGEGITMDILYNYYYGNKSTDNNNYSIVTMFNYNDKHFMLTGDLEKEGEEKMAEYYDKSSADKTLPHCDLFKAGHHGSKTSSNECLLSLITPDICVASACAGTAEYTVNADNQFPTQDFINRIAKYTDRVYVTSTIEFDEGTNEFKYAAMNGNVVVSCNGSEVGVAASNNLTKLKDTAWFNETIYVNSRGENATKVGKTTGPNYFFTKDTTGVTERPRRTWPV